MPQLLFSACAISSSVFVKKGNIVALGVKKGAFLGVCDMSLKLIAYICKEFKK